MEISLKELRHHRRCWNRKFRPKNRRAKIRQDYLWPPAARLRAQGVAFCRRYSSARWSVAS